MIRIRLLAAGAAHGLVERLRPALRGAEGIEVDGDFGPIGGLKARLLAAEAWDAAILTAAVAEELADKGLLVAQETRIVGAVLAAVAVRAGDALPDVGSPEALRAALLSASGIYFPDPVQSTAGAHVAKVLDRLNIRDETAARQRPFPSAAAAMGALAAAAEPNPIGCTQMTEILATPGLSVAGPLPADLGLETVYVAALPTQVSKPAAARRLIAVLAASEHEPLRRACGFA